MTAATAIVMLAGGLLLVVKGADYLVDGASAAAVRFRVRPIVIGLTIVAFGTSMPELVVNVFASAQGNPGLAIGNILGSNIANVLLILGVTASIAALPVKPSTATKEIPFAFLSALALWFLIWDGALDRADGLVLMCFFAIFLYYTFGISKVEAGTEIDAPERMPLWKSSALVLGGVIGLAVGGRLTVDGAVSLAGLFGVSDAVIGLTVVAVGTSLPELATSVMAALKREVDISIGNVVGSNIFNVLWVLGLSSVIRELPFDPLAAFDLGVTIGVSAILFIALYVGKRRILERWEGILFLALYAAYLGFLILRHAASA